MLLDWYNSSVQEESLFGKIAVEEGFLSQDQLETASRETHGRALTEVLVSQGLLSDSQVQIIRDIQRIHMAEVSAPAELGGLLRQDRFMLPCSGCDTYYLIQGYAEGTKFVCRKCQKVLVVRRVAEATPAGTSPASPRAIGPYDLLGEVGRGSMSFVYKARNSKTGAVVALKVLKESDSPNPQYLRRFQQEARAASRLKHPGIVHRDLKPANIILDAANRPHVTDFGLAKMEHLEKAATQGGGTIGTPWYMSPEQVICDVRGTDARSDIYAMGVMLYEALTGRVPYPGSSVVQVYLGILNGTVTPPSQVNPRTPRDLEAICLKALDRDKARRQASALNFAQELHFHLELAAKSHGA